MVMDVRRVFFSLVATQKILTGQLEGLIYF